MVEEFISMTFLCISGAAYWFSLLEGCGSSCEYVELCRIPVGRPSPASMGNDEPISPVARIPWVESLFWRVFDPDGKLYNFCLAEYEYCQSNQTMT